MALKAPKTRLAIRISIVVLVVLATVAIAGHRYIPVVVDYYFDDQSCIGCHGELNANMVSQWMGSAHFGASVGCEGCHGTDHDAMFATGGEVSPKICAECHQQQYEEFSRSGHAKAESSARENARFLVAPPAIQRQGCLTCHNVGRVFPDGGRGRCSGCHSAHRFSKEEAREPHACEGCHMGPDHPQMEAWEVSKHGIVFRSLRDETTAPTCVTCHMGGPMGHDSTLTLTLGDISAGATFAGTVPPIPMRTITREEFQKRRGTMVKICRKCHSAKFAKQHLEDADEIKRIADGLVAEAVQIIRELHDEGLLSPMPADRPPHPQAGHALVLGGDQLYSDTSVIEQRFFEMTKFHHSVTFKGAYHFSPAHTHWMGYAPLQADLTFIRGEARKLRLLQRRPNEAMD